MDITEFLADLKSKGIEFSVSVNLDLVEDGETHEHDYAALNHTHPETIETSLMYQFTDGQKYKVNKPSGNGRVKIRACKGADECGFIYNGDIVISVSPQPKGMEKYVLIRGGRGKNGWYPGGYVFKTDLVSV